MDCMVDTVELVLPFKAEFVSVARLTASGVANRVGFDYETIEDIKVAIAEVCNKLVSATNVKAETYRILFSVSKDKLSVTFGCEDKSLGCMFDNQDNTLGISIINALMDEVEFCTENDYLITMCKILEGDS